MKKDKKNIWLLSAYRSDSHAQWADWLPARFNQFNWFKLELSGRHFRWRIRGNALSWLHKLPAAVPDLVVATSMVDLSTLKGLHPRLANVPCLYYFHENQFAYPLSEHQVKSIEPEMVQLYGALAADACLFNSDYNRCSFLNGVQSLLEKFPDNVPQGVAESLAEKSSVLPVVIQKIEPGVKRTPPLILWNHRWEYDKTPQVFHQALHHLIKMKVDFRLALLGGRSTKKPLILSKIEDDFSDYIIVNSKVSLKEYRSFLSESAIVVSTAIHEFQGLAILEAVSAGAIPLVPDALCYREQFDDQYRYKAGDAMALAVKLKSCLDQLLDTSSATVLEAPDVSAWFNEDIICQWENTLMALLDKR